MSRDLELSSILNANYLSFTELNDRVDPRPASIGRGLASLLWIVNSANHNRLLPIGCIGELLVEGPILARGYVGDEDKTNAAFVQNPSWLQGEHRLYKTGDLVRYNLDGTMNYISRKDTQVKFHGQRIELAEIEHHLRALYPGAQHIAAEVVTRAGSANKQALAAFLSLEGSEQSIDANGFVQISDETQANLTELQTSLQDLLPIYMVPSMFITMGPMPMNRSGKLDRSRLRRMASMLSSKQIARYSLANVSKRAPGTDMELKLQSLFAEVLEMECGSIGADDNFFRLGGDSVSAMRLVSAMGSAYGHSISVADIFQHPQLSKLAETILPEAEGRPELEWEPFYLVPAKAKLETVLEEAATQCGIPKESIDDIYPCTPLQEGLMALSARRPGAYLAQMVFRMPTSIDVERFKQTWQTVVDIHAILRTRIIFSNSAGPLQVVLPGVVTWNRGTSLEDYLKEDNSSTVTFGSPLVRFAIIEDVISGSCHFVLTAHHAVYDGWSVGMFFENMHQIYNGYEEVVKPVPFNGFIQYLENEASKGTNEYWQSQLLGDKPTSFPKLPSTTYEPQPNQSRTHTVEFPRVIESSITSATILRAAWAIVVSKYADSTDIVFGAPLSGRNARVSGVAQMSGPTVTTVPIRVRLDKAQSQSIAAFLNDIQTQAVDMIPYEHTGLRNITHLVGDVDIKHLFLVQPGFEAAIAKHLMGLELVSTDMGEFGSYALSVACSPENGKVVIQAQFDGHVIQPEQIEILLRQFEYVVSQLVSESETEALDEVSVFGPVDEQLVREWNSETPTAVVACMQDSIRDQVRTRRDAPAICAWDGELTYIELDRMSSRLACHLVDLGVGPGILVPFCFDKSMYAVVAMLAILKAGGACVCIGISYPLERTTFILSDISANVVLVAPKYFGRFKGLVEQVVVVDQAAIDNLPTARVTSVTGQPSDPAFVIFTSGSTGTPKGIIVEHRAMRSSCHYHSRALGIGPDSRVFQSASYTFGLSIADIFSTLIHGGCICIPSEEERLSDIAGAITRMRANWACMTPTVASLLQPHGVSCLKTLVVGGEPATQEILRTWADAVELIVAYGMSESSVYCSAHVHVQATGSPTNLGKGVGVCTWIADALDHEKLAPVGCVGELLLEGPTLAREYLNDPEKTGTTFIENPAFLRTGNSLVLQRQRLYKTGDLMRYNPDGTMSFVGRKDTQVQIAGQRVELGEIEHLIRSNLPGLKVVAADVIHPAVNANRPILASFLEFHVNDAEDDPETEDDIASNFMQISGKMQEPLLKLRETLEKALPSYMVPNLFITLRKMPLNSSGKLDRRQLRQEVASALTEVYIKHYALVTNIEKRAPTTIMEHKIQELWSDILAIDASSIGADDSFLRLGGDSVSAIRLVAAAQIQGLYISVSDIFQYPELHKMAEAARRSDSDGDPLGESNLKPFSMLKGNESIDDVLTQAAAQCQIEKQFIQDAYPCTPLQEGLMSLSTRRETSGAYLAQLAFQLPANFDLDRFRGAWEAVVDMHPILRTRIVYHETLGSVQIVVRQPIAWTWQTKMTLEEYLDEDKATPVSYGSSLTRLAIIGDSPADLHFVFTAHHAVYDGWSLGLIYDDVERHYREPGQDMSQPPLFNSFIQYLQNIESSATDSFWQSEFSGKRPTSFPQLPSSSYDPKPNHTIHHSMELSRGVNSDITTSTLLRAAWTVVLARHSESDDIVFGAPVSGRYAPLPGIERISGPTLTTVPIRVRLDQTNETVSNFLQRMQKQAVDMIPFEHTGLQNIRRIVGGDQTSESVHASVDFNNLFIVQPADEATAGQQLLGLPVISTDLTAFLTYALAIECIMIGNEVKIQARYDGNIMSAQRIRFMISQFENVAHQMLDEPELPLNEIQIIGPEELKQISRWNSTIPENLESLVQDLISEQVLRQPDAPAVCAWDGDFTFKELDNLSSRLALHLSSLGVRPEVETKVALCFDKSKWYAVAMLAVVKAGGACIGLLPTHPVKRLEAIIQDCNAQIILAAPQHIDLFDGIMVNCNTLAVEPSLFESLPQQGNIQGSLPKVLPSNPAFVLYTSGTTGKPKGIVIEHAAFVTSSQAFGSKWGITPGSRVFNFASHSFDVSVSDIFTTIIRGGCVCIPSEEDRMNNFANAMHRMRVNWVCLTPTVANLFTPSDVPSLRTMVLGGEACTASVIDKWAEFIDLRIVYGPAECSINCMGNEPARIGDDPGDLGFAIGCRLWVCEIDDHNQLTPIGCIGELLVEGPILARGYLNDEAKTTSAFINNPAWLEKIGSTGVRRRFYKTGDLVRYNSDGTIHYIARKDTQVKLHGQRIELGEVEYNIRIQSHVKFSVVVLPKSGGFSERLVAVIALHEFATQYSGPAEMKQLSSQENAKAAPQLLEVKKKMIETLPEYMVPTAWILVDSFPMTMSGKVDRPKLISWVEDMEEGMYRGVADLDAHNTPERPWTGLEQQLQAIWAGVLNIDPGQITLDKSFLRLGGDSITAMQVVSRARGQSVTVSVQDVLRTKTIAELAQRATKSDQESISREESFDTSFGLSPIQQWYFENIATEETTDETYFNQSVLLTVTQRKTVDELRAAVRTVVGRHSMLRARFARNENNEWTQLVQRDADNYDFQVQEVDRAKIPAFVAECQASLNIETGPVFATRVFNSPGKQSLFLTAHHLVVDLVSWRLILRDLEDSLKGSIAQRKPLPFQTWRKLQAENAHAEVKVEAALPIDLLKTLVDFEYWGMGSRQNIRADTVDTQYTLSSDMTSKLFDKANNALSTEPLDIILATLIQSFYLTFGRHPIIFNEGHGREPWNDEIDISETVGWFTTMTPFHIPVAPNDDIVHTIRRTKDIRRRVPANGRQYFASRFHSADGQALFGHHQMELLFNYAGRYQQLERQDALFCIDELKDTVTPIGQAVRRPALFEISADIVDDSLHISVVFNRHMKHQNDIRSWVYTSSTLMEEAIEKLLHMGPERTLSDFPLLSLSYDDLKELVDVRLPQITSLDNVEDIYPCSPMQRGLLLAQIKSPALYKVKMMCEIISMDSNPVNMQQLEAAWQKVVNRHSALRTVFLEARSTKGLYNQVVLRNHTAKISHLRPDGDVLSYLKRQAPLKLSKTQPPHGLTIVQSSTGEVFCMIEISHALTDATSTTLLMRDLVLAYGGKLASEGPRYGAYISYLEKQSVEQAIDYWKQYLTNVEPCHFPVLGDVVPEKQRQHKMVQVNIGEATVLYKFCRDQGITLASLLQTVWALVLRCYTGADHQVCFGYLTSGRDAPVPDIEETAGLFINMLVCRVSIDNTMPLIQTVRKVQDDFLRGLPYQHCSLAEIQHALKNHAGRALFNTSMSFLKDASESGMQIDGEKPTIMAQNATGQDPTEYDLALNVKDTGKDLEIVTRYWDSKISDVQASNVTGTFTKILSSILASPEVTVNQLQILSERDEQQIMEWNKTMPVVKEACIDDLFREQLRMRPSAPAVCSWDGEFTYRELDHLASRLAYRLVQLGVGPEIMVPFCFDKSCWAVVTMLAIVKAGGAFIGLSPKHPLKRLETIIQDSASHVILVAPQYANLFDGMIDEVVVVDRHTVEDGPSMSEPSAVRPTNPAFILYTSGTTGKPKGIIIEHGAFCTSSEAFGSKWNVGPQSKTVSIFSEFPFHHIVSKPLLTPRSSTV